ncbi:MULTISPECIES: peptidyl-alpha-hydroxyglycine alpha-amidating lyase family protein [unclassified Rhizobium]|uniref:peptidyl-alpha-hydroxyglycine alpha-amidating lyase family protein n=1 Tax=unclassified Rhizobium TaxID=2613769 RepID=UPI001ADAAB6B|nr:MULTISPECIES: peptidyl-alpha-hydroxyglycine alpha-amidating lyase family protein [unclassified Rhizobium]MBO9126367.1 hypothetical protein [Rhizobium sp. 16-488-2b]MBO9178103.1 hypothetical protein [Rhizobium sp. 16-488-2a]
MDIKSSTILGSGEFRYVNEPNWMKLPPGWKFSNVSDIGIDSKDNVYVFDRGPRPVTVFDRDGNFLRSWGEGAFKRPHAIHIGPDDSLWLTDDANSVVRKYTTDGNLLMTLGTPGSSTPYMSGRPFNGCTHTALSPSGEIYVSDGYGNSAVHKFSPDGRHLLSWGEPGTSEGQFNIPHNITCDGDGWVYVADRENHRVQVFDKNGKYETQWNNLHKPCGMYMKPGRCPLCFIAESGAPASPSNLYVPNIGPRVTILDRKGTVLSRFGERNLGDGGAAHFLGMHGIAADSHDNIFVADLSSQQWKRNYPDKPEPAELPPFHRFRKLKVDELPVGG